MEIIIHRVNTINKLNNVKTSDGVEIDIRSNKEDLIINTDILVEDVHFNQYTSIPRYIGWKAVAVNMSDLAASGVEEILGITIGLVAPPATEWKWVDNAYKGIKDALDEFGGKILGGDCSNGKQKILSDTAIIVLALL